jgi:phosphate transport system permease protein
LTHLPKPAGENGGGMANAIPGTAIIVAIASVIGLPIGIFAGLYLAEQRTSRLATGIRFLCDVLNGLPSIVLGNFAWGMLVRPFKH